MDDQLKNQFEDITRTILSNQTQALSKLTNNVEKEIGQVWRQMGIMYGQVSNSISILEKVKAATEGYVNNTSKNLGTMEGTVTGLTDRMVDVDSNLNYMLGQLSLVVQEFNQVSFYRDPNIESPHSLCSRNFKNVKLGPRMWKFIKFYCYPIFREINFGKI